MKKGSLDKRARRALEDRIKDIDLINNYYTRSGRDDVQFRSIENLGSLDITDGVSIPDIMVTQMDDGHSEVFNRYMVQEIEPDVLDEIEVRGLPKEQALVLIQDGMQPEEILQSVDLAKTSYPGMDAQSMMLMIESQMDMEQLEQLQGMGLAVVPLENGKVQVHAIEKVAEVDADGKTVLSPKLQEQLAPFVQAGVLDLEEELGLEIVEMTPEEKAKNKSKSKSKSKASSKAMTEAQGEEQQEEQDLAKDMQEAEIEEEEEQQEEDQAKEMKLKVVPLREKAKAKTQEELEKEEIAKKLDCKPEEVLCVIRFSSREIASQYFNDSVGQDTSAVLVRLSNNKFWMMEEDREGNFTKRRGLEVSPASKLLADKLKDTRHPGDTWVLPGELYAGKSHEHSERYDFFEVALPGENKMDGPSSVMYAGLNAGNVHDMRLLTSQRNNVFDLAEPEVTSEVPARAFIQDNSGARDEIKMRPVKDEQTQGDSEIENQSTTSLADLSRQQELLIKLEIIEREIDAIEKQTPLAESQIAAASEGHDIDGERRKMGPEIVADAESKDKARLPDLYSQRAEILKQLGLNEASLVRMKDDRSQEIDEEAIRGQNRPH